MLKEELTKENFKFKKSLGQNFISDTNFLNAIVADSGITKNDAVLEIGAGAGTLTAALAAVAKKVISIEKDESLKPVLQKKLSEQKNVQFIFDDFLKLNKADIEKKLGSSYMIVANLPYYITTPIIFKIIEEGFAASSLTLMVQKEVAQRLTAKEGTSDYGAITAKINAIADVAVTRAAPRTLFYPQPRVDSAIVKINFKNKINNLPVIFNRVVNAAFENRRKMFVSNLAGEFCLPKEHIAQVFKELNISLQIRGEALSFTHFAKIAQKLQNM